jgi:hypothetical protein
LDLETGSNGSSHIICSATCSSREAQPGVFPTAHAAPCESFKTHFPRIFKIPAGTAWHKSCTAGCANKYVQLRRAGEAVVAVLWG